jgi:DNA mismatch endonuclease, patch repair protein
MSRIRGRDTRPELLLRRALHARGLRYRLNVRELPGRPDLVFPSKRAVIFMHGCFWHQHGCNRFKWPKTRKAFWSEKLKLNVRRDARVMAELRALGWRTLVVWECALTGPQRMPIEKLAALAGGFVAGTRSDVEITGERPLRLRRISAR